MASLMDFYKEQHDSDDSTQTNKCAMNQHPNYSRVFCNDLYEYVLKNIFVHTEKLQLSVRVCVHVCVYVYISVHAYVQCMHARKLCMPHTTTVPQQIITHKLQGLRHLHLSANSSPSIWGQSTSVSNTKSIWT